MVSKIWKPPKPLDGHIFCYGRTGSGKTFKMIAIVQYYFEHGYKIWDLYGGKRREGSFWCIPSDENKLWDDFEKEVGILKEPGPKEYKVNLYFPFFNSSLPDKVPELLPRIKSNIFTIYWKDLAPEHISVLIGEVTENQKRIWEKMKKDLADNSTPQELIEWFRERNNKKFKHNPLYYNFVEPLCKEKLLQGKYCKTNINFIEESKEKDRVFVLNEDYTPIKYRMFLMSYIANNLYNLVNNEKIHHKNIMVFREMNLFMKVQDEASQDAKQKQQLRNEISDIARYGRSGLHLAGDTQSPAEVKGIVEGQQDLLCINELPGARDREEACERLRKDGKISRKQIAYIGSMPVEQMVVLGRYDKNAKLLKRVQPPRTMGWKRNTGQFQKVWKNKYNSYKDIRDIKNEILQREKEREHLLKEEQELSKEKELKSKEDFNKEEEFDEEDFKLGADDI